MISIISYIAFFHSVEFYVILTFVAAAIVAAAARPSRRGSAQTHFVNGAVFVGEPSSVDNPCLEVECLEDGRVRLIRTGYEGMRTSTEASLAITAIGFDLEVRERLAGGSMIDQPAYGAIYDLDFLAQEWYHVSFYCEATERMAAFSLHVRPGIKINKSLSH
jgi:hypothetical protein